MKRLSFLFCAILFCIGASAQDTVRTYWKNNKLMSIGVEKAGMEEGHWVFYHINGAKWTEGDYVDGRKVGVWRTWYEDGTLNQEYNAENGPFKSWYRSGKVEIEGQFVNGKREGKWTFLHPNGKLYKEVTYVRDSANGPVTEYYDNGTKYFEGTYI